jgi:hypothetical protein
LKNEYGYIISFCRKGANVNTCVLEPTDGDLGFELLKFAITRDECGFVVFGEGGGEAVGE